MLGDRTLGPLDHFLLLRVDETTLTEHFIVFQLRREHLRRPAVGESPTGLAAAPIVRIADVPARAFLRLVLLA